MCGGEDAIIICEEEEGPTLEVFCYPPKVLTTVLLLYSTNLPGTNTHS